MLEQIKKLEEASKVLEMNSLERENLRSQIVNYSEEFINNIKESKAFVSEEEINFDLDKYPIEETSISPEEAIDILDRNVNHSGGNAASGRHFAYIPGSNLYPALLGDFLAATTNRYAGVYFAAPGAVKLENLLIKWMCKLVGYPSTAIGNLSSGGSIANLIGVVTARDAHKLKAKDFENAVIYHTEQTHHSVAKSLDIAGMEDAQRRSIEVDDQFRMKTEALEQAIKDDLKAGLRPWLIIATAGTTNIGAVDPISKIGDIAQKYNLWFHLDAAYGGFFILCEESKKVFDGFHKADSITMDPHKSLFIPFGSGVALIKDRTVLPPPHSNRASYIQNALSDEDELSPTDISPELSKHFRGLRLWLPLKLFGLKPFRASLSEKILLARYFYDEISKKDFSSLNGKFELGPKPDLSIVVFRFLPNDGDANKFNLKIIDELQKDGRLFLSSTNINGIVYLRLAIISFRTHLEEINLVIELLESKISKLQSQISKV